MRQKLKSFISSPADLLVLYIFSLFQFLDFGYSWSRRKLCLILVFCFVLLWQLIIFLVRRREHPLCRPGWFGSTELAVLILLADIIIAPSLSWYGDHALDYQYPEEGVIIWAAYLFIFLLLKKTYRPKKSHLLVFLLCGYVECLLVLINTCAYSLFGYHSHASNFANYNMLAMAVTMYYAVNTALLLDEKDSSQRMLHWFFAFFFSIGLIFSRSDSVLLSMAVFIFSLPFLRRITAGTFRRLLRLLSLLLFAMCAVHLLSFLPTYRTDIKASGLLLVWSLRLPVWVPAAGGCLFLLLSFLPSDEEKDLTKPVRRCAGILPSAAVLFVVFVSVSGAVLGEKAANVFSLSGSWGTGRGKIWEACLGVYSGYYTFLEKLIGTGLNTVRPNITYSSPKYVNIINEGYLYAHNFLLQWLLEGGIVGLLCFLYICYFSLRSAVRKGSRLSLVAVFTVITYLAGMLVTINTPDITPFFIVFLGICAAEKDSSVSKS